jgi:3-oxoacyl-[acyl-carrier-protein] synthase-3
MTSLVAVASHIGPQSVAIEELGPGFGLTNMQLRVFRKYHKLGLVRRDPEASLLDLLRSAVANLAELKGREHQVKYVIYARTFPIVVPYPVNPLHELCAEAGLGHAQAFTVTQHACASGLLAIDLAGRLLAGDGDPEGLALVLAGEKAFTGETQLIPETSFFGEGSSACLVGLGERDKLLSYKAILRGEFDGEMEDVAGEFQRAYPEVLAEAIIAAAHGAGMEIGEVGVILPHNVNSVAWQRVCRIMGYPLNRVVLDHVATYGHVFCADAFINYETAQQRGLLRQGERYVVAAAGAGRGATFSAMVFEH